MATRDFFPYPTAPTGVLLGLDVLGHELQPAGDGTLSVYVLGVDSVSIRITAVVNTDVTDGMGLDLALAEDRAELWLIATGVEGRLRRGWQLQATSSKGLAYEKVLEFGTADYRGSVEFTAVLVPSNEFLVPGTDILLDRGMRMAWSPVQRVLFSEPPTPPGSTLHVEWVDFQHDARFQAQATQLFALERNEGQPAVFLNEGIDDLKVVLMSRGTHGRKARIRDAIFMQIVHQAWTSILVDALSEACRVLQGMDEQDSVGDALEQLDAWQRAVLEDWAPELASEGAGGGGEAAILLEQLRGDRGVQAIGEIAVRRIPRAIQGRLDTRRGFDGLLKDSSQFT